MKSIYALSKKYGFSILEDASHAIGGKYLDKPVGNCQYSDISVFSFHPVKIITSGEGGAALTNNPVLDKNMRLFASHGITRDIELMESEPEGPWYYEQISLGSNYRMTEFQAALGLNQMSRIDNFIEKLQELKKALNDKNGDKLYQIFNSTKEVRKEIIKAGQDTSKPDFGRKED